MPAVLLTKPQQPARSRNLQPGLLPNHWYGGRGQVILTVLKAALLIWPYDEIQPFVQQAIEAFLGVTEKLQEKPSAE